MIECAAPSSMYLIPKASKFNTQSAVTMGTTAIAASTGPKTEMIECENQIKLSRYSCSRCPFSIASTLVLPYTSKYTIYIKYTKYKKYKMYKIYNIYIYIYITKIYKIYKM